MRTLRKGYNSEISLERLIRVRDPQTNEVCDGNQRVLICDSFRTYETLETLEFYWTNNITLCPRPHSPRARSGETATAFLSRPTTKLNPAGQRDLSC
jgi:hypothetical protein